MSTIASPRAMMSTAGVTGAVLLLLGGILCVAEPLEPTFSVDLETKASGDVDVNVQSVQEGSLRRRFGLVSLVAFGLVALWTTNAPLLKAQRPLGYLILAFLAWGAASIVWSDDPGMTVRKIGALGCLALGALGVARLLAWRQLVLLVFGCASAQLLLGLGAEIVLGSFQPLRSGYQYAGLGYQAFTAWTMTLLLLAGATLLKQVGSRWRPGIVALMSAAVVLLFLTKSRTPAVGFVVAAAFFVLLDWPARRSIMAATGLIAGALLGFLLFDALAGDAVEALGNLINLGREKESIADLTGRTEVWRELLPYIEARPWLGYGYESFWTPARLTDFGGAQGWAVPDAHNGYINLALGVGLPGSLLYTVVLALGLARAVHLYWRSGDVAYAFAVAVLVAQGVNMLCVAIQMAPYLPCMVTMFLLAKLGFVTEPEPGSCRPVPRAADIAAVGPAGLQAQP